MPTTPLAGLATPALASPQLQPFQTPQQPKALQILQGLEGLSQKVAAGFADSPRVRAYQQARIDQDQQQQQAQKQEWGKILLEDLNNMLPAMQQAYANSAGDPNKFQSPQKTIDESFGLLSQVVDNPEFVQAARNRYYQMVQNPPAQEAEKPDFQNVVDAQGNQLGSFNLNDSTTVAKLPQGWQRAGAVGQPLTPEEEAQRLRIAQAGAGKTNVQIQNVGQIPPEYQLVKGPAGELRLERIPGGPETERAAEAVVNQQTTADNVVSAVRDARSLATEADIPTTGFVGALTQTVPGTPAYDLAAKINTIKANVGFEQLNKLRQASKTGGALGQVTELELSRLEATIADLNQAQSKDQFLSALDRVENQYLKTIHGPKFDKEQSTIEELNAKPPEEWTPEDIKRAEELLNSQ